MKTLLVTGSSGFIGRNIVEQLSGEYDVLAPRRAELDLLDDEAVRRYMRGRAIDVVVHGATTPGHRNATNLDGIACKNLRMFSNIARNADRFDKLIYLGSGAEYDTRQALRKVREEEFDSRVPADEGGLSKYVISKLTTSMPNALHLRPFGVFGRHEDYEIRFISNAICKTLTGRPITMKQNRRFDYIWVDDLVRVLRHFIEVPANQVHYNVTPDESIELRALAELVREVSGKDVPIEVALPGMGPEYSGDNGRLRAELDMKLTPHRRAVESLFSWYKENPQLIRAEALLVDK